MLAASKYTSFVKYMGSKSKIIDFVLEGINEARRNDQPVLDLFSGSASLAGAIGRQVPFYSNDIQQYSRILSTAYVANWKNEKSPNAESLISQAKEIVKENIFSIKDHAHNYKSEISLEKFTAIEKNQRKLIDRTFEHKWHLFVKNYSGTWWSAEQCLWIDAIREVAESYKEDHMYHAILASLMWAMAYCSQGTGHYAQYREAKNQSSMNDILIYRRRNVGEYFTKKYNDVFNTIGCNPPANFFSATSEDFATCLEKFPGGTVYADPPYCFVHYSRFYHALETLVLYDFPELQIKGGSIVKGRYRVDRHQSPFCIASKVNDAFELLFKGIKQSNSNLVLSYSNTGMIDLETLNDISTTILTGRKIELITTDHQHMTLGRTGIRHRDVKECLLIVT